MVSFWERKTFCLITGASKGFGEGIALGFAKKLVADSFIVLVARSEEGLNSVKSKIKDSRPDLNVFCWVVDLCIADSLVFTDMFTNLFKTINVEASSFPQCLLVHNAGSEGNLRVKLIEQNCKKDFDDYWALNLTSTLVLNSVFFKFFSKQSTTYRYIVQITTLFALSPQKCYATYSAVKAARDVLFKVMSLEEPDIKILSYAPGPLQTDMFQRGVDNVSDPDTLKIIQECSKALLTCSQSAERLSNLLGKEMYESGSHIDYYDVSENGQIIINKT